MDDGLIQTSMGHFHFFDNVPSTFSVDREGVVRYQILSSELHGDSPTRVSWFIDQLT